MRPERFLAIITVLSGTGWSLGEVMRLAFPALPWWVAFPVGTALAFKLVMEAGKP